MAALPDINAAGARRYPRGLNWACLLKQTVPEMENYPPSLKPGYRVIPPSI
ncbi:MAG: hypothetical protein ACMUIA_00975 [bacterium]